MVTSIADIDRYFAKSCAEDPVTSVTFHVVSWLKNKIAVEIVSRFDDVTPRWSLPREVYDFYEIFRSRDQCLRWPLLYSTKYLRDFHHVQELVKWWPCCKWTPTVIEVVSLKMDQLWIELLVDRTLWSVQFLLTQQNHTMVVSRAYKTRKASLKRE